MGHRLFLGSYPLSFFLVFVGRRGGNIIRLSSRPLQRAAKGSRGNALRERSGSGNVVPRFIWVMHRYGLECSEVRLMKGDRKSRVDVEFYINLFRNVLSDAYACYPEIPHCEFERDMSYVQTRVSSEGLKFLTVQLPSLGKAIDRSMETGCLIVPDGFARKATHHQRWNIPKLFSALFATTYTTEGVLDREKKTAIPFLRQLCFLCYKVEAPFSPDVVETMSSKFRNLDESLPSITMDLQSRPAFKYARLLLRKLFRGFDPRQITPRHGPGAVAERLRARDKYSFYTYRPEIDRLYPYVTKITFGVLMQSVDSLTKHLSWNGDFAPSRVCLVPKDSRGPRVIAAEPALLQYLQQGLGSAVVDLVERMPLTRGHVLFRDQSVHRDLAKHASESREYATLDLKDASDRVSLELVRSLFPEWIVPALEALRSRYAALPDGSLVELKKFAPMGSALCFPIEALTFYALACGVLWSIRHGRTSRPQDVFVYGDDIIVPTEYAQDVVQELEQYGVLFNKDKCCQQGYFRESCGMDAFCGEDVTPVKIRALVTQDPARRRANLVSLNSNANALFDKGFWGAARFLDEYVEKHWGPIPTADQRFPGLARKSSVLPMLLHIPFGVVARWSKNLQRIEVRTLLEKSRRLASQFPSDVCRLGHNLLQGVNQPYSEEVAVPHSALTKAVWVGI